MKYFTYCYIALIIAAACWSGCGSNGVKSDSERKEETRWVVAQDGKGDFTTIQDAFDALAEGDTRQVVYVKNGTYYEKVRLTAGRNHVVLLGESTEGTILTYDDWADKETSPGSGEKLGTSASYTLLVEGADFMAANLTIRNTFQNTTANTERYPNRTQGVAVNVSADRAAFYDCRIEGYQDTFLGWKKGRIYLKDCYVEGNVDFIFGNSVMVFDHCKLFCNREYSVITAAATPADMKFGIVFLDCILDGPEVGSPDFNGEPFTHFYLGRPWQEKPKTVFIRCDEPSTLHPDGWTTMTVDAHLYAEYQCTGPGATDERLSQRKMGGYQLTEAEAAGYTLQNIFSRDTYSAYEADWMPPEKI